MIEYIKICGIRRAEDAVLSVALGANAIGVIVGARHKTEDELTPEQAKEIFFSLPDRYKNKNSYEKSIYKVLVTHLTDPREVYFLARHIGANTIQIHSEMAVSNILRLKELLRNGILIGVAHGNSDDVFLRVKTLVERGAVNMILIDTKTEDRVGGTGRTHDWNVTRQLVQHFSGIPFILAGGLKPENIEEAIRTVKPYGVDVNSGVKAEDGYKDMNKLKAFIGKALSCNDSISS
jgi:phosphoribosylanthranilate isomerase